MVEENQKTKGFDILDLQKLLPHRYPFMLVDRVTEYEPGVGAKGYKNVSINEPFFQGHFPENPIMPGVLQLEALAQCSAPILMCSPENKGKLTLFAGVDNVRFKNIVRPGDRFDMYIEMTKGKGPISKCHAVGSVDGKVCVEADLTVALK